MKVKTLVGTLLVSVALCSQGFSFELLDRLLGMNCGGCGTCGTCSEVTCCEPEAACCTPEPECCEEPVCDPCCDPCRPKMDLFAGLKGLFKCNACCDPCCEQTCCEPVTECCEPEPTCCDPEPCCDPCGAPCCKPLLNIKLPKLPKLLPLKRSCCTIDPCCEPEPTCCEPEPCCEPDPCCKPKCRPLLGLLDDLFSRKGCCPTTCGEPAGCATCGGGEVIEATPEEAPAVIEDEVAPMPPQAPEADPQARLRRPYPVYQVSRSIVR